MKDYDVITRRSSVKQWRRIVSTFLMTFATYAALHAGLGCNAQPPPPPPHGAVPGLFATDEVWVVSNVSNAMAGDSGGVLLIRGYGNTIEYIVASSGPPPEDAQFDGETTIPTSTPPLMSLGLELPSSSVTFTDGTVRMNVEFTDIQGRRCKLDLSATPCTSPDPASAACALENLEVTMTVDGDSVVPPGTALNLVRLESCPKSLDLSGQDTGWVITSVPFLALLFATTSAVGTEAEGSGTPSFPAFLSVLGTDDRTESATDTPSFGLTADGGTPVACGAGGEFSSSPPQGSVVFDGSNLQIDLAMLQIEAPDEQGNVQTVTPEDGTCTVAFEGQVTYCALWKPGAAVGEVGGASLKVIRVDGEGRRHLPGARQTGLSHVYVMFGLPDPGAPVEPPPLLPECAPGCPSDWIGDGACDLECCNPECSNDGGDCGPTCDVATEKSALKRMVPTDRP